MSEGLGPFDLFVGIGHPFRRDDGVGPWLAERLAARGCKSIVHAGDGADLCALFEEGGDIVVADATQGGHEPGATIVLDALKGPLPDRCFRNSTHEFGLAHAVETARALGLLPRSLVIIGIEGRDFGFGVGLTPRIEAVASELEPRLLAACRTRAPRSEVRSHGQ